MPNGYLRLARESFPGNELNTPTLSTKMVFPPIQSFGPKPGVKPLERDDELRNQDEPLMILPEAYEPSWQMGSRAYPDTVGMTLTLSIGMPTSTTGNGVITDLTGAVIPTGATRHRWTAPFGPSGASPLTGQFDIAYSDQEAWFKMKGAACDTFAITTPQSGGATVAASGPAVYFDAQGNPSLSPAYETLSIRPFTRGGLTLPHNLASSGVIEDFGLSISNPVEVVDTLGVASRWPDGMEKANSGPIVVSGTIPKRILSAVDMAALKEATGFELMATWVNESKIAATSFPYKLTFQALNAQYTDGEPEALQNQRRHGASISWKSTSASSGSSVFELVNATASYV